MRRNNNAHLYSEERKRYQLQQRTQTQLQENLDAYDKKLRPPIFGRLPHHNPNNEILQFIQAVFWTAFPFIKLQI